MAEKNNYYGSGVFVAGNIDIGAIGKPADSRVMVPNLDGLAELVASERVYDGMIVYCESTKTYHKCSVEWDSSMHITSSSWKQVEIQSLEELKALIAQESTAAMEFKGTIKNGALPTLEEGVNYDGNLYKITTSNVTIPAELNAEEGVEVIAKPGDSIVCEGRKWYLIPSGDDIEDTWRAIKVNGVEKFSNGTTSNAVDFVQGENVTISEANGAITIAAADTHYESKLVVANSATDAADETAEGGQVHLNLIENGEVKSSHKIVGAGGITVTHAAGADGNVITIEAPEGAKYDLTAKTENGEAILSLAGTDSTEDKVAIIGNDAVSVSTEGGKVKVSAHDTKYTGSTGNGVKVTVVDDGAISAEIEANAVTTEKIADKNVTLAKLEETIQTKLGYVDTGKNVSTAISDAINELNLNTTYVKEEGFETRVQGIKVTNAVKADSADEATHATNADNATNAANADEATHAVSADEATHATNADEATHATNADAATHATAAGKVDNAITIKVGGADVVFDGSVAKTADVDAAINAAIDAIPDVVHPEYSITKDTTSDYAATYHLTKDGVNVGAAINIPKDMVVQSGSVVTDPAGQPAGTYIKLVLQNVTEPLYINVGSLIEYVTSGSATGDMVYVTVDPTTHKVTATITDDTITEAKLHADVTAKLNKTWEEVGVAKGLVDALAGDGNTTTVAAIDARVNMLENAGHLTEITTTANNGLKVTNKNNIDIDTDVVFVLDCNW